MSTPVTSPLPMPLPAVLIVDDEEDIRDMVALALQGAGYPVLMAANGREGFVQAVDHQPALALVDWMMPEVNGIELLRRLRRDPRTASIPIIMLSAKAEVDNKTEGLDSGADDYLAKPFSTKELLARIRALLRRTAETTDGSLLRVGNLQLDPASHTTRIGDSAITLGPTEFRLLQFFMGHPNRVYSREQLLDKVWGTGVYVDERTVDVHIRRLRKALEPDDYSRLIQTVHGVGYRFSDKTQE